MTKADERALAYAKSHAHLGYDYDQIYDAVKYGYLQAEKDLALTWEDVKVICSLYEQIVPMTEWDVIENEKNYPTDESFYSDILKQYNVQRNATDAV